MFKKGLLLMTFFAVMAPMVAFSYTLTTRINTLAGQLQVNAYAVQNTAGAVTRSIANGTNVNVVIAPAAGYVIGRIQQGTTYLTVVPAGQTVNIPTTNTASQTINVWFDKQLVPVTALVGTGGSVSPGGTQNLQFGAAASYTFTPSAGNNVVAISGQPLGATVTPAVPAAVNTPVVVAFTVPATAVTMNASFVSVIANAGIQQTALVNSGNVTLDGSATTGATTYAWTQTAGPTLAITNATSAQATIPTTTVGSYQFQLVATNGASSSTAYCSVIVTTSLAAAARNQCINCHIAQGVGGAGKAAIVYANWSASSHRANGEMCFSCHVGANTGAHPGVPDGGHNAQGKTCTVCHSTNSQLANGDAHQVDSQTGCVDCHAVGQNAGAGFVQDNNGVRAIMAEFTTKRSHHITGAAPTNAQCAVCHLEGKVVGTEVVTDFNYHMKDASIHLRNADDNTDYAWNGSNHTVMDNFCFSCHDNNGAAAVPATFAGVTGFTGTASNPFGDTLTNGYDQVARAGVVDVKTAFTTTNASHHAVSGQRYKYRFSTLLNAEEWAARTGNPVPAASEIAEGHTDLDGNAINWTGLTYEPTGPEEGGEATLYEAGKFVASYIPLGASQNVADNSTLHCGDCHTVGQWKVASSTNADGSTTGFAIGAHGSANEYLLRNSEGTDAIHNGRTYVCFNCHSASSPTTQEANTLTLWNELIAEGHILPSTASGITSYVNSNGLNPVTVPVNKPATLVPSWKAGWNALHPTIIAGAIHGYASAHAVSAMHIQCEADSADNITSVPNRGFNNFSSNRLQRSWAPQTVKIYDYVPAAGATAAAPLGGSNAASGNITGIACTNCHNSGLRSGFGGIHGGDNTYTDGLGRTQKSYRFMPGMGNYRYAPPGGWDGKDVSDPTLLTATNPLQENGPANGSGSLGFPGASGKPVGGCYTNGGSGAAGSDLNNSGGVTYGVCNHHGTSTVQPVGPTSVGVDKITVTGNTARFRSTYGGGTTSSPTTYEPTVREATAGGTLVTRPLKY